MCFMMFESSLDQKTAFPGEVFSLGIEAMDEIQRETSAVIRISDANDDVRPMYVPPRPLYLFSPRETIYLIQQ